MNSAGILCMEWFLGSEPAGLRCQRHGGGVEATSRQEDVAGERSFRKHTTSLHQNYTDQKNIALVYHASWRKTGQ